MRFLRAHAGHVRLGGRRLRARLAWRDAYMDGHSCVGGSELRRAGSEVRSRRTEKLFGKVNCWKGDVRSAGSKDARHASPVAPELHAERAEMLAMWAYDIASLRIAQSCRATLAMVELVCSMRDAPWGQLCCRALVQRPESGVRADQSVGGSRGRWPGDQRRLHRRAIAQGAVSHGTPHRRKISKEECLGSPSV